MKLDQIKDNFKALSVDALCDIINITKPTYYRYVNENRQCNLTVVHKKIGNYKIKAIVYYSDMEKTKLINKLLNVALYAELQKIEKPIF